MSRRTDSAELPSVRPLPFGGAASSSNKPMAASEAACVSTDVRDVLRSAMLHDLTPVERLLVVLWYVERMSIAEIAMTLDMTELQVARTHGLVLAKLRQQLDAV